MIIMVIEMKNFLRRFFEIFVALCLITFLILITYYTETCDTYFSICLIFVSLFTFIIAFMNNYYKLKSKPIKWLYLSGMGSCCLYLILHACKFFAVNQLESSSFYSMLTMSILALSIVLFIILLYMIIRLMFDKNYTFQSFDVQGFKKALNLLGCIAGIIVMSYPTHYLTYDAENGDIIKVAPQFEKIWIGLVVILVIYMITFSVLEWIETKMKNKN